MITLANSIKLPRQLDLEQLQAEYQGGNQQALAVAIHLCGRRGLLLPSWAVEAWTRGCYAVVDRKVEGWDDVLANGQKKTVKQLIGRRVKNQKLFLIRYFAYHYKEIPISNNRQKLERVGNRLVKAPDRFDTIAQTLTEQGKAKGAFGPCSRSEAKKLWYEAFPAKHKKAPK
jgi:hypothetical protein